VTERQIPQLTRRRLFQVAGALAAGAAFGSSSLAPASASSAPVSFSPRLSFAQTGSLLDGVRDVCARLAPGGWRDLLLRVTNDELDITDADLGAVLGKALTTIDRTVPGFEDFSLEGTRGIEAGSPARSLLYHALASPNVFRDGADTALSLFPTPAELEVVENYVYGVVPPTLDIIRAQADGAPLAVVVFALEYRSGPDTVHRKHADLNFSRTGHARLGNAPAQYDAQRREFLPVIADDPFAFPVQPARYAAYLAVQRTADPASFGPLRATEDDASRRFWVPLHKLFDGPECIQGLDLTVDLVTNHVNEKLRRFHHYLNAAGFYTGWEGAALDTFPFVIAGDTLAAFSTDAAHGTGWVMPEPHPFAEPAIYQGKPLTFFYSEALAANVGSLYYSSLQIFETPPFDPFGPGRTQSLPENLPGADGKFGEYLTGIGPDGNRAAPEYLSIRHRVNADGVEENLNELPDLLDVLQEGGFWVRHFIDYSCDGWVAAHCAALDAVVSERVPAFSMVSPPTFYPYTSHRELIEWSETQVPQELRTGIWAIPPRPLSDRRLAANINHSVGFDIADDTVTAVVSQPVDAAAQSGVPETLVRRHVLLPDGAAGLFDPGWDVSQGRTEDNRFFLESYGLGTPFVEDVKLCSALSTYWPGVVPDGSREFQPAKVASAPDIRAWPTIAPQTDEELGIVEATGGGYLPWDGVRGPVAVTVDNKPYVDYPDITHTDYLETFETFSATLTGAVEHEEYISRVFAMAQVYWALGIRYADFGDRYAIGEALDGFQAAKAEWAVLSFQAVTGEDEALAEAEAGAGITLAGPRIYRFHLFTWGDDEPHPSDIRRILVPVKEQVVVYSDLTNVLLQRDGGDWEYHQPPTL
jgi:hypothetical protein